MKRSILIADDDRNVADVLQEIFEKHGYAAYKAYNGKDALELFNRYYPQSAILDIDMPWKTGLEVTRTIRKSNRTTLIVILTGFMVKETDSLECYGSGANIFLRKPLAFSEIFACVHSMYDTVFGPGSEIIEINGFQLDVLAQILSDGTNEWKLKERETRTLQLLLKYGNQIVSLNDLASYALNGGVDESNTQMLRNIIAKLNKILRVDPELIIDSAYSQGYILRNKLKN